MNGDRLLKTYKTKEEVKERGFSHIRNTLVSTIDSENIVDEDSVTDLVSSQRLFINNLHILKKFLVDWIS